MNVSHLFARALENEGVRYIFGVPGEEVEDLLFALEKSRVRFIPTRHEQGAAFMADAWGRLSGKAGVCLGTLGPGATNLMTGVADANLDKSPLVAITGQAGLDRLHKESHQTVDIVRLFRPVTKWNTRIYDPETVPEAVRKAFKIAESEKPGATHLEVPEDVAGRPCALKPLRAIPVRRPDPDDQALRIAAALLRKAKRPLVLAGNGAVRKSSEPHLLEFVHQCNIPVVHTFMGKGAISDRDSHSLLAIGLKMRDLVADAVERADLVIAVGYDIAEYAPDAWNPRRDKTIVHIDFTPAEVYAHYQPAVEIVSDIGASLRDLNRKLGPAHRKSDSAWYARVRRRILGHIRSYGRGGGKRFTVPGVLNILREVMGDRDLLVSDVGAHKIWIARNFPVYAPNRCLISNGLSSMGFALPAAVAASLLEPESRIVAAMGDGGFLMTSQELETAKRLGARFTVLIFNDNDYGLISWKQRMTKRHSTGTRLGNPDFKAYAQSFGIEAHSPKDPAELRRRLSESLAARRLCVIEVPVDSSVNDALTEKILKRKGGLA